jgi:hypothetical protein
VSIPVREIRTAALDVADQLIYSDVSLVTQIGVFHMVPSIHAENLSGDWFHSRFQALVFFNNITPLIGPQGLDEMLSDELLWLRCKQW